MLTKTTISAIRALLHLGADRSGEPISPRRMAEVLGESPTYLAKVVRLLVKAGILRAHFGAAGGVALNRDPEAISLLAIMEACQGAVLANLCTEVEDLSGVCAFHRAGSELHGAVIRVMTKWTLADLLRSPGPSLRCDGNIRCWMSGREGRERTRPADERGRGLPRAASLEGTPDELATKKPKRGR